MVGMRMNYLTGLLLNLFLPWDFACAWLAARYQPDDELFFIGFCGGVNETVDDSVWRRWDAHTDYRPPTAAAQRT